MRRFFLGSSLWVLVGTLAACEDSKDGGAPTLDGGGGTTIERTFDFSSSAEGWKHDFTDLPVNAGAIYELAGELLSVEVPGSGKVEGYRVQSHNRSDDVWMYLARSFGPEDGIRAGQAYSLSAEIAFVTTAAAGCAGVGGAPAEAVILKLGASKLAPDALHSIVGTDVRFVPDKGNQSTAGKEASIVSNISSGKTCPDATPVLVHRQHAHPETVHAGSDGRLTVFAGTDSGFEGKTVLVYDRIRVRLTPVP